MLFDWLFLHRIYVAIASFILVTVASAGITNLKVSTDNRVFYGNANKHFTEFLEFEANYTSNNNILFVLHGPTVVIDRRYAEAIRWLTNEAWSIQNVIRVDSLSTHPVVTSSGDNIDVVPLLDFYCPLKQNCIEQNPKHLKSPEITNRLVNDSLRSTGILATLNLEIGTVGEIEHISNQVTELSARFAERYPDFELVHTGGIPMMAAFANASEADLSLLLPIAFVTIFVLLYVFLGGFNPALMLLTMGILAISVTLGCAGWFGHVLNNATSIVPLIVFTLVITGSMHILLHFLRLSSEQISEPDQRAAARAALEGNLSPMIVSAATSIIGLLSLSFVDSPPLRQLGQLSALGVFVGCSMSIVILPLALSKLTRPYTSLASSTIQQLLNRYARKFERKTTSVVVPLFIFAASLVGLTQIEIDDNFVDYFDESTEFRIHTDRATELLAGPNHIEILVTNSGENGIFKPAYVNYLGDLSEYVRSLPVVSNASSFYDVLANVSVAFGSPITNPSISPTAEEYAQWYLVYELSLQQGQSNTDLVNNQQNQSRISILLKETSSKDIQKLEQDIYSWHATKDSNFDLVVTGENIPVAHLSELNINSMVYGLGGSIFLSALIVGLLLKKLKLGVATLFAILVPVASGFGIWGLFTGTIGLASTAIVALTIGIVVDDSIHLAYRYIDGRVRLDMDSWHSAAYGIHRVGTAITTTSIVMIGGLSALLLSAFEVNSSFGACTCLIIGLALLFNLLVFPRALVWADA